MWVKMTRKCHLKIYKNVRKVCLYVVGYCVLVLSILFLDFKYPYQSGKLFENDLNLDLAQKRQWNVVKQNYDFKKDDTSVSCDIYNLSRPYSAKFECIKTKTKPSTTVCLYNEYSDIYISHDLKHTGLWEPHVLQDFQEVLHRNHDIGVIDLGANIGYYTLIAAKMGHKVVAVEPFYPSIHRMHRAIEIEQLSEFVTVVHNAVADRRALATIQISGDNQGDTKVYMNHECNSGLCPPPVHTILMDDLLQVITFNKSLIKLDIQGYECQAMKHASKILDKLYVPYIFMEWGLMGHHYGDEKHKSSDKYRIQEMIRTLFDLNYRPYSLSYEGSKPLNPLKWHKWPFDIVWHKLFNTKDYEQLLKFHFTNWPH